MISLYQQSITNKSVIKLTPNKLQQLYIHPFNGPLSGTTWVSWYQKGKTNLDFTEVRDSEWQWHQLGHMQVCTSLQTDNRASTPPLIFFTDRVPFLLPNQQHQSTVIKVLLVSLLVMMLSKTYGIVSIGLCQHNKAVAYIFVC